MDTSCLASLPNVSAQHPTECQWQQLLQQERAAHHELEEADCRKDEFLAILGHELRNPLSDIVNAVEVLEQQGSHDAVAVEMHGILRRQSLHMTRLIDDLLDVSRISCGKILLQMAHIDLAELVSNAVTDHQHHFEEGRLKLVFERPLNADLGDRRCLAAVASDHEPPAQCHEVHRCGRDRLR